ncbi:MAG: hypothetical protein PHU08_07625, partial [Dehalococcoidales bacterium]|nr:hypothetical protein [Dehalococcoidales bacterium]
AEAFGVRHMGRILGFANMGSGVGSLTGPWLAGYVFDATGNYSVAFLVAAGASLAGIILVLPFGKSAKS